MKKLVCSLSIIAIIVLLVPAITMAENNVTTEIKTSDVSVKCYSLTLFGTGPDNHRQFYVEVFEIWSSSATRMCVLIIGGNNYEYDQTVMGKIEELAKAESSITERLKTIETYLRTVQLKAGEGNWAVCPEGCF